MSAHHPHAGDDHDDDRRHSHGGDHHAPASFGRAFAIGIVLNIGFVAVEVAVGLTAGSVALLADAGHNLSDVLGLAVAWAGATLAQARPSKRFTYGLRGSTIIAALFNALALLVALGAIVLEAAERFGRPAAVPGLTVSAVAGVGIAVNAATAWLFARGRRGDLNVRAAFLHMATDALVSLGVVLAGVAIWATGAGWIDPVTSLLIAAVIFWQTWGLLRETGEMALGAVPRGVDFDQVGHALAALPGVAGAHDIHIWPMSMTETALTAHLVMPAGLPGDAFLADAQALLQHRFGIVHATLQVEQDPCGLECGNRA